jgi:hypothetical protein
MIESGLVGSDRISIGEGDATEGNAAIATDTAIANAATSKTQRRRKHAPIIETFIFPPIHNPLPSRLHQTSGPSVARARKNATEAAKPERRLTPGQDRLKQVGDGTMDRRSGAKSALCVATMIWTVPALADQPIPPKGSICGTCQQEAGRHYRLSIISLPSASVNQDAAKANLMIEATGLPATKSKARGAGLPLLDWGNGAFSIDGARTHTQFDKRPDAVLSKGMRGSMLVAGFDLKQDVGAHYSMIFALAGLRTHRGTASELVSRHLAHASGLGAEAGIDYADHVRILGGYSSISGSRIGGIERSVALAWGAPRTNKGFRLALDFSPQGFSRSKSAQWGLELRHFALSPIDAAAFGVPGNGVTSAALSLKRPF